jgi:dephospho-CoA kinase
MFVIGLTGLPCSGKETVKDFLVKMCRERGLRVSHFSFSGEIRREAVARGRTGSDIDRDFLTGLVAEMRSQEGPAVLARRIIAHIGTEVADVYIVEALRHPAEAETLRRRYGGDFVLAAVTSAPRIMAERLLRRKRVDESRTAKQSVEDALQLIEKEQRGDANINVGAVLDMADLTIPNDNTLADLQQSVATRFAPLLDRLPRAK